MYTISNQEKTQTNAQTLFSTSFFNFQIGNEDRVVSWWIWLYFVVTCVLSAIIVSWWILVSQRKAYAIEAAFGGEEEHKKSMLRQQQQENGFSMHI